MKTFAFDHFDSRHIAPSIGWRDMTAPGHFVQFYQDNDFIIDFISRYLARGIRVGDHCIVVLTAKHIKKLEKNLSASLRGLFESAREEGHFEIFDANQMLDQFMTGDIPDPVRMEEAVEPVLKNAAGSNIRVLGEMVAVLVAEGNPKAAVEIERLWNKIRREHGFSLLCIYPIKDLASAEASNYFSDICCNHSHVFPDETYTSLPSADERLRTIAQLQLRNLQLEMEIADPKRQVSGKHLGRTA